jgi:hypothetical protein
VTAVSKFAVLVAVAAAFGLTSSTSASAAGATVQWFHSPSGNIECEVASQRPHVPPPHTYAYCQTFQPLRSVTLSASGRTHVCPGCVGNGPENAFTLRYGRSVQVGPFRCTSLKIGMRCAVPRSGHGFLISRDALKRF